MNTQEPTKQAPSAAALAAAGEIKEYTKTAFCFMPEEVAAIIDRHTAPKPENLPRYFRCESYSYEWDGRTMWYLEPRTESIFVSPDELMACADAYETDEHGGRIENQSQPQG